MKNSNLDFSTIIGVVFFGFVIVPLLASLIIGLVTGNLDTTPLN